MKNLPESLDWRTKNVIAPVNDLAGLVVTAVVSTGKCYVENNELIILFHNYSTELVETLHAIRTKTLIEGSFQRVYDCCPQSADVFDCIQNMSGICRKTDYPEALGTCEPNKCKPFTTVCINARSTKESLIFIF
jgi:hypothetical protein